MAELYTYAVSRIHAREADLLTASDIEQLLACEDFNSTVRALTERGYGKDREYRDFEALRQDETDKMWSLINELVPDRTPFETLFRPIDFHNLKAAVKMVYVSETSDDYFKSGGLIKPQAIYEAVRTSDYASLPEYLRETARYASEILSKTSDGQECDIYIDKVCLETMISDGKKSDTELIRKYTELLTAVSNIKIAVRGAKMFKPIGFFQRALADCDSINIQRLAEASAKGVDDICKYLENTEYRGAVDVLSGADSLSEFEKWADNMIIGLIKEQKSNPFTIQPIFAYILAKQNELKAVQIILAGKKNKLSSSSIRERIRDLYV